MTKTKERMKKIFSILLCIGLVAGFVACEKDKEFELTKLTIENEVITPTYESAEVNCRLKADATISEAYVHYSLSSSFAKYEVAKMSEENGLYVAQLTSLQDNTIYYIRYSVSNKYSSVVTTEVKAFTTNEQSSTPNDGTENSHEYVDLGLSVKWATCNVGASKPEDYGDYFAWGETTTKSTYTWSTYKYCNGSYTTLTKYNNSSSYGSVDNKTQLELSDDAAAVNWGGAWRMPTKAEQDELREKCTWTWTTQNGVNGYKVTSKKSGYTNKSIFLPAAGRRYDSLLDDAGSDGNYWSSSLCTDSPYAYYLYFSSSNVCWYGSVRFYGRSVRPVYGEYVPESTLLVVTTGVVTQITETTAVAGGNVTSDGGASVTERGVVYGTSENPTTANSKVVGGSGTGTFTCNLADLQEGTTYYVRAYAVNSQGTAYGEQVSFTTLEEVSATPEYVDLGLSVKWATFNVGASKPEEYGDYFAWGETQPKSTYDWTTYKYCNGSGYSLTKYCTNSSYGSVDNKTQLELSDDAARVNWGGSWRMPTEAEQEELRANCTWTWTTQNGVNGYKVTSKSNGNSIFLPAAGYRFYSSLGVAGSLGYYWSSSLDADYPYDALRVSFSSSAVGGCYGDDRYYGLSVRPVCP